MRTLLKAGLRIFSLLLFLNLIEIVTVDFIDFSSIYETNKVPIFIVLILLSLLEFALLLFIWIKADKIVEIVAGKVDDQKPAISVVGNEITTIALRVLGIYLILRSIPQIAGQVVYQVAANNSQPGFGYSLSPSDYRQWAVQLFTLLIGLGLVVGAGRIKSAGKALANFWKFGNTSCPEPESTVEDKPVP